MPIAEIVAIIVTTSLAAVAHWVRNLLQPAETLGLTIFRPYRGDVWPRGVQEDYEVHFDLTPKKPAPAPIQPSWAEIVVGPTDDAGFGAVGDDVEIEDLDGETAAIEHVEGTVHIAPH